MGEFQQFTAKIILAISAITLGMCILLYHVAIIDQKFTFEKTTHINSSNNLGGKDGLDIASNNNGDIADIIYDTINEIAHGFGNATSVIKLNYNQLLDASKTHKEFKGGVILVSRYAEQQIGAAMNLFSLQKWAKTVNAFVVEPFVINSEFRLPFINSPTALSNMLRFHDYFNINIWNEMSIQNNGTPLISWEHFLTHKRTKYIFVNVINDLIKDVEKPLHINDEIMYEPLCQEAFSWFKRKHSFYINILVQAKLVRRVCFSFYKTRMNISDFTRHIYGPHDPSEVIVWILTWKGFAYNNRVRVVQQYFHRSQETLPMVHASNRVIADAQNYVGQYLGTKFGEYVGISIRTVVRAKYLPDEEQKYTFFKNCFKNLGETIQLLNVTSKKIFMSLDLGRFGDKTQTLFISPPMISSIEDTLFQTVYNGSVTMQEWESSFIDSTNGITDSGYIAAVQRTILDNSKCLIMFGGRSNFQRSIAVEFKEKHGNNSCIYNVCYIQ